MTRKKPWTGLYNKVVVEKSSWYEYIDVASFGLISPEEARRLITKAGFYYTSKVTCGSKRNILSRLLFRLFVERMFLISLNISATSSFTVAIAAISSALTFSDEFFLRRRRAQ